MCANVLCLADSDARAVWSVSLHGSYLAPGCSGNKFANDTFR